MNIEKKSTEVKQVGVCSLCGESHPVDGELMAEHYYTVARGGFLALCVGEGHVHYGHKDSPKVIERLIDALEIDLIELPDLISCVNDDVIDYEPVQSKEELIVSQDRNTLTRYIKSLNYDLRVGVPDSILKLKSMLKGWVEIPTVSVDYEAFKLPSRNLGSVQTNI